MINILHLYYDLLNLYGENANVRSITRNLDLNNIKYNVDLKSINDDIDFMKYDIIYIGSGSEEDILLAINDINKRKKELKEYIDSNRYLFLTGNSGILFGKYLEANNEKIKTLDILPYTYSYITDITFNNASKNRIVGEVRCSTKLIDKEIIGFQNRCCLLNTNKNNLFETEEKYSNDLKSNKEGFNYKNVYLTHLIGPLFIRNPYLLDYFLEKILNDKNIKYSSLDETAKIAYKKYLENF